MSNIQSNIKFKDNISHIATHNYFNNDLNNYGYEKHTYQYETYNAKKTSKTRKRYQCEYCFFSTNRPNGTAVHKWMMHRCKYRDNDDNQCESFNCQKHCQKYIFRCI